MTEPLLLSIPEAAKRLGIGQDSVRELVKCGRIASVKVGTRNRKVPAVALEEYVTSNMTGGKR